MHRKASKGRTAVQLPAILVQSNSGQIIVSGCHHHIIPLQRLVSTQRLASTLIRNLRTERKGGEEKGGRKREDMEHIQRAIRE